MTTKLTFKDSFMAGLMAAGAATVVNAILFLVFHAAGVISDTIFIQPNQPMTIVPIIISSILPTLVATLVFFLLEKYTKSGFKIFRIISIVLLVLSFINPFVGIVGVTVGYAVVLNIMHIVVVAALLYFIGKSIKKNTTA
jgi:Family of unknown function (DUF6069)